MESYDVELKDFGFLDHSMWTETTSLLYKLSDENKIEIDYSDNWEFEHYINDKDNDCYKIIFPEKYNLNAYYELEKKVNDIVYGKLYYNLISPQK